MVLFFSQKTLICPDPIMNGIRKSEVFLSSFVMCLFRIFLCFCFAMVIRQSFGFTSDEGQKYSNLNCHQIFSTDQLLEDTKVLLTSLHEIHPDLYRIAPKDLLMQRMKEIRAYISEPRSYLEFLKQIALLFTEIGDIGLQWGHSRGYIDWRHENLLLFPSKLHYLHGDVFHERYDSTLDDYVVTLDKVVSINGIPFESYFEMNRSLLPIDGNNPSIQMAWLCDYFPNHHSNFWEQPDTFKIVVREPSGQLTEYTEVAKRKADILPKAPRNLSDLELYREAGDWNLVVRSLSSRDFKDADDFKHQVDSLFQQISEQESGQLYLILPSTSGGEPELASYLFSYFASEPFVFIDSIAGHLKPPTITHSSAVIYTAPYESEKMNPFTRPQQAQPNAYTGKVIMDTDGWSFGAAGLFCAQMRSRKETFFYSPDCGASKWGMSAYPIVIGLPHTEIQVIIPRIQLRLKKEDYKSPEGIELDEY